MIASKVVRTSAALRRVHSAKALVWMVRSSGGIAAGVRHGRRPGRATAAVRRAIGRCAPRSRRSSCGCLRCRRLVAVRSPGTGVRGDPRGRQTGRDKAADLRHALGDLLPQVFNGQLAAVEDLERCFGRRLRNAESDASRSLRDVAQPPIRTFAVSLPRRAAPRRGEDGGLPVGTT